MKRLIAPNCFQNDKKAWLIGREIWRRDGWLKTSVQSYSNKMKSWHPTENNINLDPGTVFTRNKFHKKSVMAAAHLMELDDSFKIQKAWSLSQFAAHHQRSNPDPAATLWLILT